MGEYHDENTLFKVKEVLDDIIGVTPQTTADIIRELGNAGILFREFKEDSSTTGEVWDADMHIRLEALTLANDGALDHGVDPEFIFQRADQFVDYIKNGARRNR